MEQDTIRLLRECDAGIQMGVGSLERILKYVHDPELRQMLIRSKHRHMHLAREIHLRLDGAGAEGKALHPMARWMAMGKVETKMRLRPGNRTAADLVTQGGNMGIQSLFHYLNSYPHAGEGARNLAQALIECEERMVADTRKFL